MIGTELLAVTVLTGALWLLSWRMRMLWSEEETLWAEFLRWRALAALTCLMFLSVGLSKLWVIQYPGVMLMQAVDENKKATPAVHTVLITVTKDEYEDEFKKRSPLAASRLESAIERILRLKPKVLAVDFDVSDATFQPLVKKFQDSEVVWARGLEPPQLSSGAKPKFALAGLGGVEKPAGTLWGIAGFGRQRDFAIRTADGCVAINNYETKVPTFHRVIYQTWHGDAGQGVGGAKKHGDCDLEDMHLSQWSFLTLSLLEAEKMAAEPSKHENTVKGKVAILGGVYSVADYHPGPAGLVPGIHLVGSAVESQIHRNEGVAQKWPLIFGEKTLEIIISLVVCLIYFRPWGAFRKLATTLFFAALVMFIPGVLFYYWGLGHMNPFLIALGILIDQLYEGANLANRPGHPGVETIEYTRITLTS